MNDAYIKYVEYYLPDDVISNEQISNEFPEWDADKIFNKVGVKHRHIAKNDEFASDLAVNASFKLFNKRGINSDQIDYLIYCTQSPDYFLPATSCLIHKNLKLRKDSGAIDINQGCSGYIYGLSLAKGLINSAICNNVLLITSDTYNKYIKTSDKSNRTIFGDGATASLISNSGAFKIEDFIFGTDGNGAENLIVKNGSNRNPFDFENKANSDNYLHMNGGEIFNFTLAAVPNLIDNLLEKVKLDKNEIDLFVFHQANKYMLETLRRVCGIETDKFINNMENSGNTVSSTIPICLSQYLDTDRVIEDKNIVLAGFGVGYSWGACNLKIVNVGN